MSDITGRVVVEAIPKDDESKKNLAAFLMRHSKHATPDSVALMLSQLPVILAKNISEEKGRTLAAMLEKSGAKARFIPFSRQSQATPVPPSLSQKETGAEKTIIQPFFIVFIVVLCAGIGIYVLLKAKNKGNPQYASADTNRKWVSVLYKDKNFQAVENQISALSDKDDSAKMYELYRLYHALGRIRDKKDIGNMEKTLNQWQSKNSDSYIPLIVRGWFFIEKKQPESAVKDLEKAYELHPEDPNAACNLIAAARELNLPREKMEEYFEHAISISPNHVGAYLEKFEYLKPSWRGTSDEMFGFARKAMILSEEEPLLSFLMVGAYEEDQKTNAAKDNILGKKDIWTLIQRIYNAFFVKYQDDMIRHACYAYHASMAQKYEIAAEQFDLIGDQWIEDACWDSPETYTQSRSLAYIKKGESLLLDPNQYAEAVAYMQNAIRYYPSADAYVGLGMAHWHEGHSKRDKSLMKKAEAAMEKALELDPKHESAKQHLTELRKNMAGF
jgi:tetratricopeptide (TPR) repeat protein